MTRKICPRLISVTLAGLLVVCSLHVEDAKKQSLSSVAALGANIICNKIPGLAPRQRTICQSRPDAMVAVGEGVKIGVGECRFQFRKKRWNCTYATHDNSESLFGDVYSLDSKETAFTYAIKSAGVAFSITQACSQGNLTSCGCDKSKRDGVFSPQGWKWGGCSADVKYGLRFARIFMDAREIDQDERSLVNLHNNQAGRKAVKDKMRTECKCHGVSGSCTMKTCWTTLPRFHDIGDRVMAKYKRARMVIPIKGQRAMTALHLKLSRSKKPHIKPRLRDIVFLNGSPNYCDYDLKTGSMGTEERSCNRTSNDTDGCESLCCGRGYNTHQYLRTWQCNCKFHWCCRVTCQQCEELTEEFTCK